MCFVKKPDSPGKLLETAKQINSYVNEMQPPISQEGCWELLVEEAENVGNGDLGQRAKAKNVAILGIQFKQICVILSITIATTFAVLPKREKYKEILCSNS